LYDVDERMLGHLVAAPVPPALAAEPADAVREPCPDTDDGARLRARHQVFRKLLDDPVVYYDELSPREYEWLDHSRAFATGAWPTTRGCGSSGGAKDWRPSTPRAR
jgi:hypothetical protein